MAWRRVLDLDGGRISLELDVVVGQVVGTGEQTTERQVRVDAVRWRNDEPGPCAFEIWQGSIRRLTRTVPANSTGTRDLSLDLSVARRTDSSFAARYPI
jgi:hypothetical protein